MKNKLLTLLALTLLATLILAACGGSAEPTDSPEDVTRGGELFVGTCSACHGPPLDANAVKWSIDFRRECLYTKPGLEPRCRPLKTTQKSIRSLTIRRRETPKRSYARGASAGRSHTATFTPLGDHGRREDGGVLCSNRSQE